MQEEIKFDRIGIISGGGSLPQIIADNADSNKIKPFIVGVEGSIDYSPLEFEHITCNIGQLGKAISYFNKNKIKYVCFAGKINRPGLSDIKIDATGLKLLGKIGVNKLSGGDNHILNLIVEIFETKGFTVISPEKLSPNILATKGVMTKSKPSKGDQIDIELGQQIIHDLSKYDIGQSVIIANKYVIGVEAAEGTDNLIKRSKDLKKDKNFGVLVKRPKTGQNLKIDLPTIGKTTVQNAIDAGLKGIAIEAGKTIMIDKTAIITLANKHNLFIVGI